MFRRNERRWRIVLFEIHFHFQGFLLRLRSEGVAYGKLSRAHGYLDGYMRVLLETGLFSQKELLALISEERNLHDGPATGIVTEDARDVRGEAPPADAARSSRAHAA